MAWYDPVIHGFDSLADYFVEPMQGQGGAGQLDNRALQTMTDAAPREEEEEEELDPMSNEALQGAMDAADADERQRKLQAALQAEGGRFQQQNFPQAQPQAQPQPQPGQVTGRNPRFGPGSAHHRGLEDRKQRHSDALLAQKQRREQVLTGRGSRLI